MKALTSGFDPVHVWGIRPMRAATRLDLQELFKAPFDPNCIHALNGARRRQRANRA